MSIIIKEGSTKREWTKLAGAVAETAFKSLTLGKDGFAATISPLCPDAGIKFASTMFAGDGGKKARSPGRSRISRKTIAWGMSGTPGDLAVNTRVHTHYPMRTRGCGCARHPAFPAPSGWRGRMIFEYLGRIVPRDRGGVPRCRHCEERSDEAIHTYFVCCKAGLLRFARNDDGWCRGCLKLNPLR
jgi:hypothetical protein